MVSALEVSSIALLAHKVHRATCERVRDPRASSSCEDRRRRCRRSLSPDLLLFPRRALSPCLYATCDTVSCVRKRPHSRGARCTVIEPLMLSSLAPAEADGTDQGRQPCLAICPRSSSPGLPYPKNSSPELCPLTSTDPCSLTSSLCDNGFSPTGTRKGRRQHGRHATARSERALAWTLGWCRLANRSIRSSALRPLADRQRSLWSIQSSRSDSDANSNGGSLLPSSSVRLACLFASKSPSEGSRAVYGLCFLDRVKYILLSLF